ncbi:Alpha-N-acetylgalactosaminide alpha-2,6-sialyltransferase 5 [Varanus komodoensis]|nr:Alpha-N-acetylgalactosaminide alpha-2,6-sialyltransferase 5 [Varanus komodoensis]
MWGQVCKAAACLLRDRFLRPLKMHCASCALVTSSGHLLRSQQGHKIDQTECVIRMNDAPTRGFGKDVGNKTSLRVIAHSSIQRILRNRSELLNMSQGTVFIFWGPSIYMRRDGKGLIYNNLQLINKILPQLKVYMISRHKMLQFDELFKQETGKDSSVFQPIKITLNRLSVFQGISYSTQSCVICNLNNRSLHFLIQENVEESDSAANCAST